MLLITYTSEYSPDDIKCDENPNQCPYYAQDHGKNEKHGDNERALGKAKDRIKELEEQLKTATGNDRKKIEQKIKNITRDAQRKAKGEEHSRGEKR